MIPGSDAGFGSYPFGQFWRELECCVEIGMSALEALVAAMSEAAEAIGIGDLTGRLDPGKQAYLLVVEGNPAESIGDLADVTAVFLGGRKVV